MLTAVLSFSLASSASAQDSQGICIIKESARYDLSDENAINLIIDGCGDEVHAFSISYNQIKSALIN